LNLKFGSELLNKKRKLDENREVSEEECNRSRAIVSDVNCANKECIICTDKIKEF
jgi:hypothetical protein